MHTDCELMEKVRQWNATERPYPQNRCIHQLFEDQAAKTPDAIAVVFEDQSLTYSQLNVKANQLAHYLRRQGVRADTPVAICMDRSLEMIIALYGVLKAGGAYVPLDPIYPRDRMEHIVKESGISIVLSQVIHQSKVEGLGSVRLNLEEAVDILSRFEVTNPTWDFPVRSLAYIIYTSGSTGKPKGVMNEHRGILNRLLWMQEAFVLDERDRVLQKTPYSFDVSVWEFFWPLMFGAQLVVARSGGHKDPNYLIQTIMDHDITTLHFVPSMLELFLQSPQVEGCRSVRQVFCSGEALGYDLQQRFFRRMTAELHNLYGPTEAAVDVSWWRCRADSPLSFVPIGKPVTNTRLYILDASMNSVPPGSEGELYIGGVQVARGYVNRPELTAERFLRNPFSEDPESRLYKTGDICRWLEDGNIEYLGRADDQVKIRGFRIELGEIESVLLGHPTVRQAVVMAREDEPGQKYLAGYVVLKEKGTNGDELQKYLASKLPEYMVPSVIMGIESIPLTTSGKADRKSLPRPFVGEQKKRGGTLPQTETEKRLAAIWKEVLGIESVHLEDHFFRLGGHSLKAIQVIYRVQSRFNIQIPVSALFENPTLKVFSVTVESLCSNDRNRTFAIPIVSRQDPILQSYAQQRLWFIEQLSPELAVYNISFMLWMEGKLNIHALETSLQTIIDRHEAFRTTFGLADGKPAQVVHSRFPWNLQVIEVPIPAGTTVREEFSTIAKLQAKQVFNLETGPVFDFRLLKAGLNHYALLLNMHHLITDGWSMGVMTDELTELYSASLQGRKADLAELPVQYADYGTWQRQRIQSLMDHSLRYWRETLSGDLPEVTLPTDRPRPAVQTFPGRWIDHSIQPRLYSKLHELSRNQQVTLNMTLMTVFKIMLHRVLGVDEVIIGGPISGRTHREIEKLVGFFVNTVVLRTNLGGNPTFLESLDRVQRRCRQVQEHQELPYDVLVEQINPLRDPSRNLFFQIMFAFQDARYWQPNMPGVSVRSIELGTDTSKFDLTVFAEENDQGLLLRAEFNTDLYHEITIRRFLRLYEHILESVVADPHQKIDQIELLGREDAAAISSWNATNRPYPRDRCIHRLFEDQASKMPDAIAVEFEGRTLAYSQLNAKANQLAHYLRHRDIGPDVPVGICMDRSLEMIVALVAILKSGGVYVPLDPLYPAERLRFMAEDVGLKLILADAGLQAIFPESIERIDPSQTAVFESYPTDNPGWEGTSKDLAYIVFTSGSTGTPKGVAVPHRGVVRLVFGQEYMEFGPELTMLQLAPVSFDASTLEIWGPLLHGGKCVLYPGRVPELDRLQQVLRSRQVNTLWLTASLFNLVVDTRPEILRTVATVLTGGEALSVPHIRKALEALPEVQLVNGYGPTESTTFTCCYRIPQSLPERLTSIPIGRPIGNTQVYILDLHRQMVPIGVAGELYIGGDGLAQGYVNRPELTAERFIRNPFSEDPASRLYKTGDICRWLEGGNIEYLGRVDDQVKIRGFRIELGEIESMLRNHPSVLQAVVMAREDVPGQKYLAGYVVLDGKGEIDGEGLRKDLGQKLPEYMVPSMILEVEAIPLMASGKADRKMLPKPSSIRSAQRTDTEPHTEIQKRLATVWKEVLGVETAFLEDHFFRLGGHSILAAKLFYYIQQSFGIRLPMGQIFESPTLGQLSQLIEKSDTTIPLKHIALLKPGVSKVPIFYFPGGIGFSLSFHRLSEIMKLDHPQYKMILPGTDGEVIPYRKIEDLARYFVGIIRSIQPHGPYYLCGISYGGAIAFETACQIQAAGESVGTLCLIGTSAPGYPRSSPNRWVRIGYRIADFWSFSPKKKLRYIANRFRHWGSEAIRRHRRNKGPAPMELIDYMPSCAEVLMAALEGDLTYRPTGIYRGPILLFRETHSNAMYLIYDDPAWGWKWYVDGEIDVHWLDCVHSGLFKSPSIEYIGQHLKQRLLESLEKK